MHQLQNDAITYENLDVQLGRPVVVALNRLDQARNRGIHSGTRVLSRLLGVPVVRPRVLETTALGAAYLAGLTVSLWSSRDELAQQWKPERRFEPRMGSSEREARMARWREAVSRLRYSSENAPAPQPCAQKRSGRAAVTLASFCLSDPAADLAVALDADHVEQRVAGLVAHVVAQQRVGVGAQPFDAVRRAVLHLHDVRHRMPAPAVARLQLDASF